MELSSGVTFLRIEEVIFSSCSAVHLLEPSSSVYTTKVCIFQDDKYLQANLMAGRARGLLELDLKLDDLLEMQKDGQEDLDLEYVQFDVSKVLALLNKRFSRKK